jgi:hypothetical protein
MSTSATFNRRTIMKYGAAAGALATVGVPALPAQAHGSAGVLPAPRPIPGGIQIPGGPLIHVHAPGPTSVTLPFSHLTLEGLDVEPGVITDRSGFIAVAFHAGTATGNDGKRYNLETDMRVMDGSYVAADGSRRRGLFAFV